MPYTIEKAIACNRWDLIVNGIVIDCGAKWQVTKTVERMVRNGLLVNPK